MAWCVLMFTCWILFADSRSFRLFAGFLYFVQGIDLYIVTLTLFICSHSQEEEVGDTIDNETRRKHFYQIEKSLVVCGVYFCFLGPRLSQFVVE